MAVEYVCQKLAVSQRRACQVIGQARVTQRHKPFPVSDERRLTQDIVTLATRYGRYGYRRITALLRIMKWDGGSIIREWRESGEGRD